MSTRGLLIDRQYFGLNFRRGKLFMLLKMIRRISKKISPKNKGFSVYLRKKYKQSPTEIKI